MSFVHALLPPDDMALLREALGSHRYTSSGIAALLGESATAATRRNDFREALRVTEGSTDPLATLVRLFVCGQTESIEATAAALGPLPVDRAAPLLELDGDGVRAALELEPYGDWWVVADLSAGMRPGLRLPTDHVLGIGGASTTLAGATLRTPVDTALDLGTGSGVQALHLSTHAARVTATDFSERALTFAATTAALNGLDWELLRGDLVAPVAGRRFDLVVSNPPFVAGPGTTLHTYRDSGRAGDALCAELVAAAPGMLNPGGHMQFLANWLHVEGEDWQDRIAGWLAGTGLDAWVIQREVSDPVAYVNLWLSDASEDPAQQPAIAAAWLDWFDAAKVSAVGFGLVTLRAGGNEDPTVRIEAMRQTLDSPLAPIIGDWFAREDWLRAHTFGELLDARVRTADGLQLRQEATRGPEGWEVGRQLLALTDGARWIEEIDPVAVALVAACDGNVTLRDLVDVLAAAHGVPADALAEVAVPLVAHLVERGILLPAS
jgi:methylase of polypeptide subunit release factors